MFYFHAKPRDNTSAAPGCPTCCCDAFSMRPGETNNLVINYAAWSVPLGGRGLASAPLIEVERIVAGCPDVSALAGSPPSNTSYTFSTAKNTDLSSGDLSVNATPEGGVFEYDRLTLGGPANGTVLIDTLTGEFVYSPANGYSGIDRFFYKMTDQQGRSIVKEVAVAVGVVASPESMLTPLVRIHNESVVVDNSSRLVTIPITLSREARQCEMFRIHVKQSALNCDALRYDHISCYDLSPGKC